MATWDAEQPPVLGDLAFAQKVVGGLRIGAMVSVTVVAVAFFLMGRGLRAMLGRWVVFHFWVARKWSRACLSLAGLRVTVSGKPIETGALVANHSSWLDILALRSVNLVYFVSKDDVARWPGVGFIARITGTVFIKRKRTEAKRQEAVLRERIAHNQLLCFFPEGTSSDGLRVLPFKSSLFSVFYDDTAPTGIAVQPVSVKYTPSPKSDLPENFYGWWGTMSFEGHIWDVVARSWGGTVDIVYHPPVLASAHPDRKTLADHCQSLVAGGMRQIGHATPSGMVPVSE
ncbi:MAG: lysophospholipid acyltransferase family protein [Pseudomonadota bacterium]